MTTLLQVLVLWVVLSALAAAAVCLLITGSRVSTRRRSRVAASTPLHAVEDERVLSA